MGLDSKQVVKLYTTRLVNSLVPLEFGQEYIQSITNELLHHILNKSSHSPDFNVLLNNYKKLFVSRGRNNEWIRFNSIVGSLTLLKSVEQIRSYLVFLGSLKGIDFSDSFSSSYDNLTYEKSNQRSTTPLNSSPYKRFNAPADLIHPYYETLDEAMILQNLSYTLTGIDSQILRFVEEGNEIKVHIPPEINNSYSLLLGKIVEAALIYVKLKNVLADAYGLGLTPVKTSFLSLLKTELSSYSEFVNNMFNEQVPSLIAAYNRLSPVILRLRLFYSLTSQIELSGYEFLQATYELTKFGDKTIQKLSQEIFLVISVEYYQTLENWIVRGELLDTSNEFFVEFNSLAENIQDIIVYLPKKVPSFFVTINQDLGFKIFQIGKILTFLSRYCKELDWVNNYIIKYSKYVYEDNDGLKSMKISVINSLINNQYDELVNYLTYVVHGKYELITHLQNFKKFLLMSSNDFIDSLVLKGFDLFNEPSNQLTSTQLSKILVDSVNFSSIKNYNLDFKNRLDARILSLSHGNIGWQVFTIEYKVNDLPINVILDYKGSSIEYLKMFNFLWKLKQFSYLLNLSFLESNNLKRTDLREFFKIYNKIRHLDTDQIKSLKELKIRFIVHSFKLVSMIRFKIIKFLSTILEYLFEQIEQNYSDLLLSFYNKDNSDKMKLSSNFTNLLSRRDTYMLPPVNPIKGKVNELNFDELISLNQNYTRNFNFKILDSNTTGKSGESYISQLYSILETIYKFINANEEFTYLLIEYISLLNIDKNYEMQEIDSDLEYSESNLKNIMDKIHFDIYDQFKQQVSTLSQDLRGDLDLKELGKLLM